MPFAKPFFLVMKEKSLKILYKILKVAVACFLILSICCCSIRYVKKRYVYPLGFKEYVFEYSKKYKVNNALVFSLIKVESGFNKNAKSEKGALGLMQLTPETGEYIARLLNIEEYDLTQADCNIKFGCFYLSYLEKKFSAAETVIVAYNAGEGNVMRWLENNNYSKNGINLDYVPFKESREYLEKVKQTFLKYTNLYGNILDKKNFFS